MDVPSKTLFVLWQISSNMTDPSTPLGLSIVAANDCAHIIQIIKLLVI